MLFQSTDDARTDRTPLTYTVSCTDCAFETIVEGDTADVFDVIDDHEAEREHFVEAQATKME